MTRLTGQQYEPKLLKYYKIHFIDLIWLYAKIGANYIDVYEMKIRFVYYMKNCMCRILGILLLLEVQNHLKYRC